MIKLNLLKKIKQKISREKEFKSSSVYWDERYRVGGNSGQGSYGQLAKYKAEIINDFIVKNNIVSCVEFGCGDGNQLQLYNFKKYLGYDVSETVLSIIRNMYKNDAGKKFKNLNDFNYDAFDLSLSIDVIYHLVEDNVFIDHMEKLFASAYKYVIIYSSNFDFHGKDRKQDHVRHRQFTGWVEQNIKNFKLIYHIPNKFSKKENDRNTSYADFFIYQKLQN
jgi:SAM-dependent methyltransferase